MALKRDTAALPHIGHASAQADADGALRLLLDVSLDAVVVMDAAGAIAEWNDHAATMFGRTRDEAVGREMAALIIPEQHRVAHRTGLTHFLATGEGPILNQRIEITALRRTGVEFPVELTVIPLQLADRQVFIGSLRDFTDRRRTEVERQRQAVKAEALYRIIAFAAESHTFEEALRVCLDCVHRLTEWPVGHVYLPTERAPIVLMPTALWHGADDARYAPLREITESTYLSPGEGLPGNVWQSRTPLWIADVDTDLRFARKRDGGVGVKSVFAFPIISHAKVIAVVEFFAHEAEEPSFDMLMALRSIGDQVGRVFERRRAEDALREQTEALETAYRINLSLAGELDHDALVQSFTEAATRIGGAAFGAFLANAPDEKSEAYALYARAGAERSAFEKRPLPDAAGALSPAFAEEGPVLLDDVTQTPRADNDPLLASAPDDFRPIRSYLAVPVVSRYGQVLGSLFLGHPQPGRFTPRHRDIVSAIAVQAAIGLDNARHYRRLQREVAERQRGEEHQKLLLAELNHRVKNMLAVVTGIAAQTARSSRSIAAFNENFMARLSSLGRAHTLLTAGNWSHTSLRVLIEELLTPQSQPEGQQIQYAGPPLPLPPKTALAVSMILHELVTNATKYGALSVANGRIFVNWNVSPGEAGNVHLIWRETGLVDFVRPKRVGFGSRMIRASAEHELGGTVEVSYERGGIRYDFRFPANQ